MNNYLRLVEKVVQKGKYKPNRTGIGAFTIPFVTFEHDMGEGFPLLTTKRVPLRLVAVELEGFIHGITDKKWYQERNCHIWDEWSNPESAKDMFWKSEPNGNVPYNEHNRKLSQKFCNDLGPIYGYQWRHFGAPYHHGQAIGVDQLKEIVEKVKQSPNDRRMVCSAWNPCAFNEMALPPCHVLWNVVIIDDTLNLGWYQRSCDLMLGVPFNIASYGLLLTLLAQHANLKPGVLHGTLADCHIYENHIETAKIQLEREPKELPKVSVLNKSDEFDFFCWTHKDLQVVDYNPHPKLDFGEVAV